MNLTTKIYSVAGQLDVVYLNALPPMIARQEVQYPEIQVNISLPVVGTFSNEKLSVSDSCRKETHVAKTFFEFNPKIIMTKAPIRELIDAAVFKQIAEEFKILVAQKAPEFFLKDLNLDAINGLSAKYAEAMGGNAVGAHINLSQYQQFFVIINLEDFRFMMVKLHDPTKPYPELRGKLVNFRPDRLVMGRYENLQYLKELSSMERYTAGSIK